MPQTTSVHFVVRQYIKSSIFKLFFDLQFDEKCPKTNTLKINKNMLDPVVLKSTSLDTTIKKPNVSSFLVDFVEQIHTRAFALSRTKQILNA